MNFEGGRTSIHISRLFCFVFSLPFSEELNDHLKKIFAHISLSETLGSPVLLEEPRVEGFYKALNYLLDMEKDPNKETLIHINSYLNLKGQPDFRNNRKLALKDIEHPKPKELESLLEDFFVTKWGKQPIKSWTKKKTCLFRYFLIRYLRPFESTNTAVERLLYLYDCHVNNTYPDLLDKDELDFTWSDFLIGKKDKYVKKEWA